MVRKSLRNIRQALSNTVESTVARENFLVNDQAKYTVVVSEGLMTLRHYTPLKETAIECGPTHIPVSNTRHPTPILLIPPLGVYTWIFDLMPTRSLVKFLLAQGFDVYLIDWGSPSAADCNLSLEDYVFRWMPHAIDAVLAHSEAEQLSLLGYCMGGLLALMYLGSERRPHIKNLVTIASPIDFHENGVFGKIFSHATQPGSVLDRLINRPLAQLNQQQLHVPGNVLSLLFKLTNPMSTALNKVHLLRNVRDRDYLNQHLTVGEWFTNMTDYPGSTIQQMIEKFAVGNDLAMNTLAIGNRPVDLSRIEANLLALGGKNDAIVNRTSAKHLLKLISSKDKRFMQVPGGHAGIFAGSNAPKNTWDPIATWLSFRS